MPAIEADVMKGAAVEPSTARVLWQAALLFLLFSVIQVAVNGVVLDETVIAAQIIGGTTVYDAGHPHAVYYTQAYSLPHYLSAAAWRILPSAEAISAVRNVLVLFLGLYAAFVITYTISRRQVWAYLAVAIVIAELNLRFSGLYPLDTFPMIYSNGNVGLQLSILIVGLLIGRMWRSSALLLGLLPSVHAMFAIILWPWALLVLLARRVHHDREAVKQILVWGGLGLVVCAGLYVLIRFTADYRPPVPPYDVVADGATIREQFRLWTDGHRRPFSMGSFGYMMNAVAFFALCGVLWTGAKADRERDGTMTERFGPVILLGVIVWSYVYGTRLWLALTGSLPDSIYMTMPSRFSNVSTVMLPVLTALAVGGAVQRLRGRRQVAALVLLSGFLIVGAFADANIAGADTRRLFLRNGLFTIWGMLLAFEWAAAGGRRRGVAAAAFVVLVGATFSYFPGTRLALYMLAAAAGTAILMQVAGSFTEPETGWIARLQKVPAGRWLAPGVLLLFFASLPGRVTDPRASQFERWSRQTDETRAIDAWLEANARPEEPVLTVFIPNSELQLKTGQPLLFEHKTLWIMTYVPKLAPVIGTMARDLYGVNYEDPASMARVCDGGRVNIYCLAWNRAWEERSPAQWAELGERYRFRLVLSATTLPLSLPVAVAGDRWTLYEIPDHAADPLSTAAVAATN